MKNLLFISSLNLTDGTEASSGVGKKILLEIRTFRELGFKVDYVYRKDKKYLLKHNDGNTTELCDASKRWFKDFNAICQAIRLHIRQLPKYDMLYLRVESASYKLLRLLKTLRQNNGTVRFVAEIPTVSKKWENGTRFYGKTKFIIKELKKHIFLRGFDLVATFDNCPRLYGVKTVCIENFADVSNLPVRTPIHKPNELRILAIALMTEAHGYDRIIRGLAKFYKEKSNPLRISLTVIGDGPARSRLEHLSTLLGLNDVVDFVGLKNTAEISWYVDHADIGAGSLAIFRKKCKKASELKIREYCSRALPFFYSADEPLFTDFQWCLKVPHDESPINMDSIIGFINSLDIKTSLTEMRSFAEKYCTCRPQLQKIVDTLNIDR